MTKDNELSRRSSDETGVLDTKWVRQLAARIVVDVCELEHESPEDQPMACVVYAPELSDIVERRVTEALSPSPSIRTSSGSNDTQEPVFISRAFDPMTAHMFASPQSPYPGGEVVAEINDVIWRISDEELRHIAESKDTGSCRVRIKQALVKAFGQTSPATEQQEVSEAMVERGRAAIEQHLGTWRPGDKIIRVILQAAIGGGK